jgi:hypothetical protein
VVLALSLVATPVHAGDDAPVVNKPAATTHAEPATTDPDGLMTRASIRRVIEKETASTQLPADIAEAVVFVESRYDPTVIGGVGEIGLMQVRPETASMLGFRGSTTELARPEVNIHYGVIYLNGAWKLAAGDLCRALMKYRAGHGEEVMTPRSQIYCNRARNRLIAMNSPFASPQPVVATISEPEQPPPVISREKISQEKPSRPPSMRSRDAYAGYARGTAAGSRAFWTAHEARVQRIKARIEARWKRVATR